jgi:(1->4)-alpha-D-glucan 1-alpha-D-glucosylmutase
VQFGKEFGFDDAAALAPYLAQLGISHLYASPYLQARLNSKHGYDITDHNSLNTELGGHDTFLRMVRAFRDNGLEYILDYVPNHMASVEQIIRCGWMCWNEARIPDMLAGLMWTGTLNPNT